MDTTSPICNGAISRFSTTTNLPPKFGVSTARPTSRWKWDSWVDASNSVRDRFRFEQDSAIEFLNQTIRPRYDQAFVVGFDVTPEVTQDFTDNTELLSHGVRSLRPGGGTAMFDALYFACRDKLLKTHPGGLVRRAIIMLSDGDDNQSHVTREEAIDMADRADVLGLYHQHQCDGHRPRCWRQSFTAAIADRHRRTRILP